MGDAAHGHGVRISPDGKKAWVSGLFWQPCEEGQRRQWLRALGKNPGYAWYCWRKGHGAGSHHQAGFSRSSPDLRRGLPSIAACLADQMSGSWVCVFQAGEAWLGISARDDMIEPRGDRMFYGEQEARDWLNERLAWGGYARIYAPSPWNIPESREFSPESLDGRRKARLYPVSLLSGWLSVLTGPLSVPCMVLMAVGGLLFALDPFGWVSGGRQQVGKPASRAVCPDDSVDIRILRPWEDYPRPGEWLPACRKALARMPAFFPGWNVTAAVCQKSALRVSWSRGQGMGAMPGDFHVNAEGTVAEQQVNLEPLKARGGEETRSARENTGTFLALNLPMTLKPGPAGAGYRSIVVNTWEGPWDLPADFMNLPGLVLTQLEWNPGSGWKLEGVLHEK